MITKAKDSVKSVSPRGEVSTPAIERRNQERLQDAQDERTIAGLWLRDSAANAIKALAVLMESATIKDSDRPWLEHSAKSLTAAIEAWDEATLAVRRIKYPNDYPTEVQP